MENLINFISSGNGYNHGYGNGNGYGYRRRRRYSGGYGNGDGNGYGDGDGNGDGNGYGIKKINGMDVVKIDNIPTAIKRIRGNIAFGYVFGKMQLKPCYVVKQDNIFAHGKTVREAFSALQEKQ